MKKKKLLIITAIAPFPQDSGGATRIKNTIKELSKHFELYLISFKNPKYTFTKTENNNLKKWCKKTIFISLYDNKINGSFIDLGQPYWFSNWYSPELINIVNNFLKENQIDIIQIEFSQLLYLIDYLSKKDQKKCIFTSHDISTISFFRRFLEVKNPIRKVLHFLRLTEIYSYERKYIPKYRLINCVSENDAILLKKYFRPKKVINLPNGIEKIEFLKCKNSKNNNIRLGYIGSFSHPPNKTAFLYFLKKIAPKLEKQKIKYRYIIAGKNSNQEIIDIFSKINLKSKNKITNLGFVDNPKEFFDKIDALITPILAGSGSRIKILEALGYGKKIISSPIGAEGINLSSNLISICKTPNDYIKEIQNCKKSINYQEEKAKLSELTWEEIFKKYSKLILNSKII